MSSNSPGGVYEILGADLLRPENAFDEILRPQGEGDHPGLWVQFAQRLGATGEELAQAARSPLAEVAGFPLTMTYSCRRSAEEGLASWYADEEQLPEVHGATALALRKYYDCDDATIEYFVEHVRADLGHSDANEVLLAHYCDTPLKIARARRAAMATLWAWREMHQGILRELERRYPAIAAA
jgi:pyrroloquinoline-quinone synthase